MYCFKIAFLWVVFTLARCEDSLDIFDGNYLSPTVPDSPEARYNYLDANYKSMKDFFSEMTRLVEAMQSEGSGGGSSTFVTSSGVELDPSTPGGLLGISQEIQNIDARRTLTDNSIRNILNVEKKLFGITK
ncbi:uncharacterized protein LOC144421899 isoform X1 [Styela clava]